MLQPDTLQYLRELNANNNKAWFDANKKRFEAAKKDVEQLVAELLAGSAKFEPALADFKAKDCVFRIYRDVRFSKDKTPYKNNMGAWFNKGGKKSPHAGYYLHIEPGNSFFPDAWFSEFWARDPIGLGDAYWIAGASNVLVEVEDGGRALQNAAISFVPSNVYFQTLLSRTEGEFTSFLVPIRRITDTLAVPVTSLQHLWTNTARTNCPPSGIRSISLPRRTGAPNTLFDLRTVTSWPRGSWAVR